MKVLIADDELVTRTVMARATKNAGHEIATSPDGQDMLTQITSFRPDVVLVDWQMPVLDGVEAIRQLRERPDGQDIFVILVTSVSGDAKMARAMDAGIDDYILKPISAPRLRIVLSLAEARLNARLRFGTPSFRGKNDAPAQAEVLAGFGDVVVVDASGRVSVRSPSFPLGEPPQDKIEGIFAGCSDAFQEASLRAIDSDEAATFVGSACGVGEPRQWAIRAIRRDTEITGFVVGEAFRMTANKRHNKAA